MEIFKDISVVVLSIMAGIGIVLLALFLTFCVGWLVGWGVVWFIPALGLWTTTTLGVTFPFLFGVLFTALRLLVGSSK